MWQQQQRKSSVADVLDSTKRLAEETAGVGRAIAGEMALQEERLRGVEDTLESHEYVLNKSSTLLRGMSWSGWLYNLVTADPPPPPTHVAQFTASASSIKVSQQQQQQQRSSSIDSAARVDDEGGTWRESQQLDNIQARVEEIHSIAVSLSRSVGSQNESIERIEAKTEQVKDKTLSNTLKAAQVSASVFRSRDAYVGSFQFIEQASGKYLAAVGEDLRLVVTPDKSTFFECFEKGGVRERSTAQYLGVASQPIHDDGILIGLKSGKTLKYIGSTWIGSIKVLGNVFGAQEQCHVKLNGEPTGIFVLSLNWGAGGWLKAPQADGEALTNYTANVADKSNQLLLTAKRDVRKRSEFLEEQEKEGGGATRAEKR